METINALTLDIKQDGWKNSRGFVQRTVPMPVLNESERPEDSVSVIIKVRYAGICGSDRGIFHRAAFSEMIHQSLEREQKTTRILGHEFVGEVVDAGSMVGTLYNIAVGNNVSGDSHVTCGKCFQCRMGEQETCQNHSILGISIDGIYAPFVKIPAKNLWVVDFDRVRPEICAMYDPFGNAIHTMSKVNVQGSRVAIFGCGQIGLFSILLARHFGAAKVIGVDTNQTNLDMARECGAHETILLEPSKKENDFDIDQQVVDRIMEVTYGKGVDVSMEMAGYNSTLNNCIAATRFGGEVVLFGIKDGNFVIPHYSRMVVKGLTLYNVIGRQIFQTWQTAQRVLSDRTNGVQDKMWSVILREGTDTITRLSAFTNDALEQKMKQYPKLLFDIQS